MATGGEPGAENGVPVVLRVKRKRTEDPAESLVVKKLRKLESSVSERDGLSSVFHLVGTFPKHDISQSEVLDQIKSYKPADHSLLVKKNPFSALTISDRQEDRREKKKVSSQSHRFKVVSKHRCINDTDTHDETRPEAASIGDTSSAKELMSELVHLYDVVAEEPGVDTSTDSRVLNGGSSDVKEKEECGHKAGGSQEVMETAMSGTAVEPRDGAITCNSMEMIREKQQCTGELENEYVYDLYYARDYDGRGTTDCSYDWESLCIYDSRYGIELFNYDLLRPSSFNDYDDEDDSNDEDNWRNDYPDEEDLFHSDSDEEGLHSRTAYRYHDSYDDYIFDEAHDDPYQQNTSYWITGNKDHDQQLSRSRW